MLFFFWRTAGWYESWKNKKKWYPFRKWTLVNYHWWSDKDANQLDVWCSCRLNEMMWAERENTLWSTLFDDMLSSLVNVWKRVSIVLQDRPKTLTIEIRIPPPLKPSCCLLITSQQFLPEGGVKPEGQTDKVLNTWHVKMWNLNNTVFFFMYVVDIQCALHAEL